MAPSSASFVDNVAGQASMCYMVAEQETQFPWVAQLRRGAIEHCILALLTRGERYGFELVKSLSGSTSLIASQGTIYPLLGRLRRNGLVDTVWRESAEGPPRRYYALTEEGRRSLAAFTDYWTTFSNSVNDLLIQGEEA